MTNHLARGNGRPEAAMERFAEDGYCIRPNFLSPELCQELVQAVSLPAEGAAPASVNRRNLLQDVPLVRRVAESDALLDFAGRCASGEALPVRALLFDKTPAGNWYVGWHQDVTIAVRARVEVEGFGAWSVKDDVPHVHAPVAVLDRTVAVLDRMVAVRLHLDDCDADNGALQVIPGSHRHGKLDDAQIARWRSTVPPVTCNVARGGALWIRPLLLHASSRAVSPGHRRVIHVEYATPELPGGLEWFERAS